MKLKLRKEKIIYLTALILFFCAAMYVISDSPFYSKSENTVISEEEKK
tara:strand:- start:498 stop:641 length:144 start_codon:yes stop_codon:yes gene_type:complete